MARRLPAAAKGGYARSCERRTRELAGGIDGVQAALPDLSWARRVTPELRG